MEKLNSIKIAEMSAIERFNYDKEAGILTNKSDGKTVGSTDIYTTVNVMGSKLYVHRVAMLICGHDLNGKQVDHKDRDKTNNKYENLRVVDATGNARNMPRNITNTSGVVGVYKAIKKGVWNGKWIAKITVDYKSISLGTYDEFDDAVSAREIAEKYYGFHENHGK